MFNSYINSNRCKLCYPSTQGKIMITTLIKKLNYVLDHSLIHMHTNSYQNQRIMKKEEGVHWTTEAGQSFSKLLAVIGGTGENVSLKTGNCKHQRITNLLRKRIFCDASTLDHLCQTTLSMIAQGHYHLQLLAIQVKHAAQRIATKTLVTRKNSFQSNVVRMEPTQLSISGIQSSLNDIQEVDKPKALFFSYQ